MKTVKLILVLTLLMSASIMATTFKLNESVKKVHSVLKGNSMDVKGKPGLAVELNYKSEHVEVGEVSDVNITITTELNAGILKVKLKALKDSLVGIEEDEFEFNISETEKNSFPINLQLSSAIAGIHYINLVFSVEDEGSRVYAVPVNVGTISSKIVNETLEKTDKGIVISVSSAVENIK